MIRSWRDSTGCRSWILRDVAEFEGEHQVLRLEIALLADIMALTFRQGESVRRTGIRVLASLPKDGLQHALWSAELRGGLDAYAWVYERFDAQIKSGQLRLGERRGPKPRLKRTAAG